ncbi:hypothetical protein DDB_G0291089 [Dictyostelium discoideum AX4]|uniref:Putative uncharacterized protein DDB_G0291089 n=1 Tax=Dictyostelium discoideum TaxID=44689 RepID=Y9232_DICDI|nr:hypothetical protein DDB_G0291089 [Dictyostelium discoideum AX4]Q54F60.1 RecName: Full=Putative uncharacterized protein DDB_G0291089 [Dictyostelium discoideum]EAL61892.1 hypothetical protein DDB_G0291089 [Dictyostelium discoideum AX4]|eukprot:XP_635394.1 hypothetical protein DDB_G0291089 [Dictyostelium discoideum AX4]
MALFNSISKIGSINSKSNTLINSTMNGNAFGSNEISVLANTNVNAATNTNLSVAGITLVNAKTNTNALKFKSITKCNSCCNY